jgi:hypothetical protein
MSKRFVVIVDQSSAPSWVDGFSVFGPYSLATADSIMGDISNAAMEGDFDINKVIVAPFHEGPYNVGALTSLLGSQS